MKYWDFYPYFKNEYDIFAIQFSDKEYIYYNSMLKKKVMFLEWKPSQSQIYSPNELNVAGEWEEIKLSQSELENKLKELIKLVFDKS